MKAPRASATPLGAVRGRQRTEEAFRETEELLRQGMRVAHLGMFDHDQITDAIYWSPEIAVAGTRVAVAFGRGSIESIERRVSLDAIP